MRRLIVLLAVIGLALPSLAAGAQDPDSGAVDAPPETDAVEEHIALAMAQRYDMPLETTRRWAIAQGPMMLLAEALYEARPDLWGGSRIDHAAGQLIIHSTAPAETHDLLGVLPETDGVTYQVVSADHTMDQLNDIANWLRAKLDAVGYDRMVTVVPGANEVEALVEVDAVPFLEVLRVGNSDRFDDVRVEVVTEVPEPESVSGSRPVHDPPGHEACFRSYEICDPPLRGGLEIDQGYAYCSAGFVVRSKIDRKPYVLTAAHCFKRSGSAYYTAFYKQDSGLHDIGPLHNYRWREVTPWHDEAIMRVDNPSGWGLPHRSAVLVQASSGISTRDTARDGWYEINAVGSNVDGIPEDGYLCMTGGTTDTRCHPFSRIDEKNLGVLLVVGGTGPCSGDSGGPVYAQHRGYGIIVRVTKDATPTRYRRLRTVPGPGETGYACAQYHFPFDFGRMWYMSLTVSLAELKVELMP